MPDFIQEIRENWPSVRAAQWVVIAAFVVGATLGFGGASYFKSETISVLRERLAEAQDRLAASPLATTFKIIEVTEDSYLVKSTDDLLLVNKATGSPTTIRLPSAFAAGKRIVVKDKKGDANKNHISVVPEGGPIDGLARFEIVVNHGAYTFVWDGRGWTWF
jgi:hypothetical protein